MTRPTSHSGHWLNRGILALLGIVLTLFGVEVWGWSLGQAGRGPLVALGRVVSLVAAIGLLGGALSPNSSGHLSLSLEGGVDYGAVSTCCEWEAVIHDRV